MREVLGIFSNTQQSRSVAHEAKNCIRCYYATCKAKCSRTKYLKRRTFTKVELNITRRSVKFCKP